jgi:hypothetical protein
MNSGPSAALQEGSPCRAAYYGLRNTGRGQECIDGSVFDKQQERLGAHARRQR